MRQNLFRPKGLAPVTPWPASAPAFASRLKEQPEFGDNPGALRMFAYVPATLKARAPLVVLLHGCGQSAADYDLGTGCTQLADQLGFIVLAPEQTRANNMNTCFNWFQPGDTARGEGEAAFIRAMIEWMAVQHPVNRARIFITGLSAGGAVIAGLPSGGAANMSEAFNHMRQAPQRTPRQWGDRVRQASPHKGALPVLSVWHGDADTTVHASNGEAVVSQWLDLHNLRAADATTQQLGPHRRQQWRAPGGSVVLESIRLAGMGHGVPVGGPPQQRYGQPGMFFFDAGISSTVHIAVFWGLGIKPVQAAYEKRGLKALPATVGSVITGALKAAGLRL